MYTTTYLIDKQQDLLHSTGNYTQHLVIITYNRTNLKSFMCICVYIYIYVGEGNGNPLQYSCLENPMDGGAW